MAKTTTFDNSHISLVHTVDEDGNYVAPGGGGGGTATSVKQDEQTVILGNILTELATPVTELPHTALDVTADTVNGNVTRSGAGETSMVAAVASQTTRLHAYAITVPSTGGTVEIRNGASGAVLRKHVFPAGLLGIVRDFNPRPYAKTSANTALIFYWSGTGDANIDFDYKTST